jgi:hypothetical protein
MGGALLAAFCVAALVDRWADRRAAIVAVVLLLSSSLSLRLGPYQGGHWVAAGLIAAAMLQGELGRWRIAGALLSTATLYDMHGALGLIPLLALAWRARMVGTLAQGLMVLVASGLALLAWCGSAIFEQTFVYALMEAPGERVRSAGSQFARLLAKEPAVFALALGALLDNKGQGVVVAGSGLLALGVVWLWPQNLSPVVAFCVLVTAAGVGTHRFLAMTAGKPKRTVRAAQAVVAVLMLCTVLPHTLSGLSRHRGKHIGNQRIDVLVRMVRSRLPASKRIWGDSAVVPTIAFRSGLRIPANEFDTNDRRLRTQITTPSDMIERAFSEGPPAVILVRKHGVALAHDVRRLAFETMGLDWVFRGGVGYRALFFLPKQDFSGYSRLVESPLFDTPELHLRSYERERMWRSTRKAQPKKAPRKTK